MMKQMQNIWNIYMSKYILENSQYMASSCEILCVLQAFNANWLTKSEISQACQVIQNLKLCLAAT